MALLNRVMMLALLLLIMNKSLTTTAMLKIKRITSLLIRLIKMSQFHKMNKLTRQSNKI